MKDAEKLPEDENNNNLPSGQPSLESTDDQFLPKEEDIRSVTDQQPEI